MRDTELRLDGNAAGGVLSELFTPEATTALVSCAACGSTSALGAVHVYDRCPGTVLRCPGCSAVLMRLVRVRDRLLADFRGIGLLSCVPEPRPPAR